MPESPDAVRAAFMVSGWMGSGFGHYTAGLVAMKLKSYKRGQIRAMIQQKIINAQRTSMPPSKISTRAEIRIAEWQAVRDDLWIERYTKK